MEPKKLSIPEKVKATRKTESLEGIFTNEIDVYNSRYVSIETVSQNLTNFEEILQNTLEHFQESKVKGFFITISLKSHHHLFKILSDKGFYFHHAENDEATLATWLPKNKKNRLPGYSSHYVGVGGIVINFNEEKILVIKEKSGHDTKGWKIPGGLVDIGEYLPEAVEREVFEETGVKGVFRGIVALREKTPYSFGRNDFYVVCLLEKCSDEISQCQFEVEKCEWISIDEFCSSEFRVETQKKISLIAKKINERVKNGKKLDDICWGMDIVTTELPTLKAEQPFYHCKL